MRTVKLVDSPTPKNDSTVYKNQVVPLEEIYDVGYIGIDCISDDHVSLERRLNFTDGIYLGAPNMHFFPEIVIDNTGTYVLIFNRNSELVPTPDINDYIEPIPAKPKRKR